MPPSGDHVSQVTQVTKTGWFTRMGNAFKGIFIGFLLFIASFVVLYWNEGRVDKSDIAATSTPISATEQNTDASLENTLISVTGNITTEEQLGDGEYLKADTRVALSRSVEVYAWVEESTTKTKTAVGGTETQETTYSYKKDWVTKAPDSTQFYNQAGHENVAKAIPDQTMTASNVKVGVYNVESDNLQMPSYTAVALNDKNVTLPKAPTQVNTLQDSLAASDQDLASEFGTTVEQVQANKPLVASLQGNYIYLSKKNADAPEIGDIRMSYRELPSGTEVTLFGKLDGSRVITYVDQKTGESMYRALRGSREQALQTMHSEYTRALWIFRFVGFFLMWIGLMSILSPLVVLADVVPIFGSLTKGVVNLVTFVVALVLSTVTVIISMILHNPLVLILVVVAVVAFLIYFFKKSKTKPASA